MSIIGATYHNGLSSLVLCDLREPDLGPEWVVPSHQPRTVCVFNAYLLVGHTSGLVAVLDTRNGLVVNTWRAHEGPILEMKPWADNFVLTSSIDRNIILWDLGLFLQSKTPSATQICEYRGHRDPPMFMDVYRDEVFSISGSKLAVAPLVKTAGLNKGNSESDAMKPVVEPGKYVSDVYNLERVPLFKQTGTQSLLKPLQLTCITVLEAHQVVLIGTDEGHIKVVV